MSLGNYFYNETFVCNLIPSSNPAKVNSFYSEKLFEKNKIIYKRGDGWPILVRRTEVIFYLDKEQRTLAVDSKHYHDNNKNVQNAAQICYEIWQASVLHHRNISQYFHMNLSRFVPSYFRMTIDVDDNAETYGQHHNPIGLVWHFFSFET